MHHVVPVLCIIAFIIVIELQLKKRIDILREELNDLQKKININKNNIDTNKINIKKNRADIDTNSGKIKELNHGSNPSN